MTNISFYELRQKIKVVIRIWMAYGCLISTLYACSINRPVSQGILGKVYWFEGDLMPGINKEPVEGIPVKREIYVYRITHTSRADMYDQVFFLNFQTDLVRKTWTDHHGNFSLALEPGQYSLFTKEPKGFFANRFSGEGFINPVEVREGDVTEIVIRIDYQAAY